MLHDFQDGNGPVPSHRHPKGGGIVADTAYVADGAYIGEKVWVFGHSRIGSNYISCHGNARICSSTLDSRVTLDEEANITASHLQNIIVSGKAHVNNSALFGTRSDSIVIRGDAVIQTVEMCGDIVLHGGVWKRAPIFARSNSYTMGETSEHTFRVECQDHPYSKWKRDLDRIADNHDASPFDREMARAMIKFAISIWSNTKGWVMK